MRMVLNQLQQRPGGLEITTAARGHDGLAVQAEHTPLQTKTADLNLRRWQKGTAALQRSFMLLIT